METNISIRMSAIYKPTVNASKKQNAQHVSLFTVLVRLVKTWFQNYVGNPCFYKEALAAVIKSQ